MKRLTAILLATTFCAPTVHAADSIWGIKSVQQKQTTIEVAPKVLMRGYESQVILKNGKQFSTNLVEVKEIGVVESKNGIPFLIFSGRNCVECDMNTSIYIHSPENGDFGPDKSGVRYGYPGKLYFYEDNSLIEESRMFYGTCLGNKEPLLVWHYNILKEDKSWKRFVFVAELFGKEAKARYLDDPIPNIESSLELEKQGKCKEVAGMNRTSEP